MTKVKNPICTQPDRRPPYRGRPNRPVQLVTGTASHGTFVLRIEDTDVARSTQESIQVILDAMTWLGMDWDEGPYYQTERISLYREAAERLLRGREGLPMLLHAGGAGSQSEKPP